ncbi:MAG: threonine aldolase family protein [Armatimonadota bacterium]|nr:MAG: threonine aldolase family protein [Armatimonadota bacterium]
MAIDLRSDTSSTPDEEMREAMRGAVVGNDGFGDDPTVNRLQDLAAERLGKEAALFVPSGTMANLVSMLTLCRRADGLVAGRNCHMLTFERGIVPIAGVVPLVVNDESGAPDLDEIRGVLGRRSFVRATVMALENTHYFAGAVPLSIAQMQSYADLARKYGLKLYVDGARLFNAEVALGSPAADLCRGADMVSFCLSKGLSAPIGSLIVGRGDDISRAREMRWMLGGQMRQVGILAAAGIVALEKMTERLAEDHQRARRLAAALADIPGLRIEPPQTNMVRIHIEGDGMDAKAFAEAMAARGVLVTTYTANIVRMCTYRDITDADVDAAAAAARETMAAA